MVLERFLFWLAAAPAQARADAARALVAAYGRLDGDRDRREHVDRAVAVLLDDPVSTVRRALAEAAACSGDVPRHVIVALSRDASPVSVPVLRASPALTPEDLIEALKLAELLGQLAVAGRKDLPAIVSASLAEEGEAEAVLALCRNSGATITPATSRRIIARFGRDGAIREAMLQRTDLTAELRLELVHATAQALAGFAVSCAWMSGRRAETVIRECTEAAVVTIAAADAPHEPGRTLRPFATALQADGRLTPALLLRALMSGDTGLFEAALGARARVPPDRVAGALSAPSGLAFASLYAKAALPPALLPAFRAALAAAPQSAHMGRQGAPVVQPDAVARVRAACPEGQPALSALLARLDAEGMRDGIQAWRRATEPAPPPPRQAETPVWMLPRRPVFRLASRAAA